MKKYLLLVLSLFLFIPFVNARDVTDYIQVTKVTLQDVDGNEIDINKGDNLNSYSNGIGFSDRFGFSFEYDVGCPGNTNSCQAISSGDTAILDVVYPDLSIISSAPTSIINVANNQEVGTWNFENTKIKITFNDNASDRTFIKGKSTSGNRYMGRKSTDEDFISTFGIQDVSVKFKYLKNNTFELPAIRMIKQAGVASNNQIKWNISYGQSIERYLTDPNFSDLIWMESFQFDNLFREKVFIEDKFIDAIDLEIKMAPLLAPPISDTNSTARNMSIISGRNMLDNFTLITQNDNETIESFRTRIKSKELQYGIYKDKDGLVLMIYLGDFPNRKLKYNDINNKWNIYDDVNNGSGWGTTLNNIWSNTHSPNNVVYGAINYFNIAATAYYKPVIKDTEIKNTVKETASDGEFEATATGILEAFTGIIIPVAREVHLYKFDSDTNSIIQGSKFKLLKKDSNNEWKDYSEVLTTDEDGKIIVSDLPNGEYKFEEIENKGYLINSAKYYINNIDTIINTDYHFIIDNNTDNGFIIYVSNEKGDSTNNNRNTNPNKNVLGEVTNPKTGVKSLIALLIPLLFAIISLVVVSKKKAL